MPVNGIVTFYFSCPVFFCMHLGPPTAGELEYNTFGLPACSEHGILERPRITEDGIFQTTCMECPFEDQEFSVALTKIPDDGIWHLAYMNEKYNRWSTGSTVLVTEEAEKRGLSIPEEMTFHIAHFEGSEDIEDEMGVHKELKETFEGEVPKVMQFTQQTPEFRSQSEDGMGSFLKGDDYYILFTSWKEEVFNQAEGVTETWVLSEAPVSRDFFG